MRTPPDIPAEDAAREPWLLAYRSPADDSIDDVRRRVEATAAGVVHRRNRSGEEPIRLRDHDPATGVHRTFLGPERLVASGREVHTAPLPEEP